MLQSAQLNPGLSVRRSRIAAGLALVAITALAIPWKLEAQKATAPKASGGATSTVKSSTSSAASLTSTPKAQKPATAPKARSVATVPRAVRPASTPAPATSISGRATTATISASNATTALTVPAGATIAAASDGSPAIADGSLSTATAINPVTPVASTQAVTTATPAGTTAIAGQATTAFAPATVSQSSISVTGRRVRSVKPLSTLESALTVRGTTAQNITGALAAPTTVRNGRAAQGLSIATTRTAPLAVQGVTAAGSASSPLTVRTTRSASALSIGSPTRPDRTPASIPQPYTQAQFSFNGMPLTAVLRTLYSQSHGDFVAALGDLDRAKISGDYKNMRPDLILLDLLGKTPINGQLVALDERGVGIVTSADDKQMDRVTLRFHDCPATDALGALFTAAHVGCVISSELKSQTVTASLTNTDFRTALETILKSFRQPATYQVERGVYHIKVK